MRRINRKSAPKVTAGRVQRKNNWDETADYYNTEQPMPVVERKRPGAGYRHVLKQQHIHDFIAILPDWSELSKGLNAIVLAAGEEDTDGYHVPGVVHICAWESDFRREHSARHHREHDDILERLGVPSAATDDGYVVCEFNEKTARAYQLLHVLLHELGHHHDAMTNKSKQISRGEPYAEAYARQYADIIWQRYLETFELF